MAKSLEYHIVNLIRDDNIDHKIKLKKIKYIMQLGANIDKRVLGKSIILWAEDKGDEDIINLLAESCLEAKQVIDKDEADDLANKLFDDIKHKNYDDAKKRIEDGALFYPYDSLYLVLQDKNLDNDRELIDMIVSEIEVNEYTKDFMPLYWASSAGNNNVIKALIKKGADIDYVPAGEGNALIVASKNNHADSVRLLIESGATVDIESFLFKSTPLLMASYFGSVDAVKVLVESGANIYHKNSLGNTALHKACEKNQFDVIKYLISQGADISLKNNYDMTSVDMTKSLDVKKFIVNEYAQKQEKDASSKLFMAKRYDFQN